MKKLAIVTVNYNNKQDTLEFLESLKKLDTKGFETKLIVVDNGSTDGSVSAVLKQFPNIILLQTGVNKGYAGGFNHGLCHAMVWGADYFFVANNDLLIKDKSLVNHLVQVIEKDTKIGIVSPKILFAPGFEFHKDRYANNQKGKVIWYAGADFDWNNIHSLHRGIDEVDGGDFDRVEKTSLVSGACFLVKREVLEKVGMFDETLFAYLEDTDFSVRVKKAGFLSYYDGGASVYHKVSRTAGIGSWITDYFHARNRLIFGMRYASFKTKLALLREAVKLIVWGRSAQRKGILDFLRNKVGGLPEITKVSEKIEYPYKLSIVFSNYNTAELCRKLLESIFDKKSGFDPKIMEVIMLDDCSPTDPYSQIKNFLPKMQFIRNKINQGFTRSYNKLMYFSRGEYILILNSDMEVLDNALTEILKASESLKGEAVLGGRLYFSDMSSQDSVYHFPTIWGAIKEYMFDIKGSYFMYVPNPEIVTQVEGIVGACMLIPRKVINKVGVLSEEIVSYFEDHEYCRRLGKHGIPIYFIPKAKFIHHHGASFKQLGAKTLEIHRKSSIQYYGKFYYIMSYITLLVLQKITGKRPPGSMEPSNKKTTYLQKLGNLFRNLNLK